MQSDGRHELWIHCPELFDAVYDHHERIWLYGDIEKIIGWVEEAGIASAPLEPIPVPHMHNYHPEFDPEEDSVLAYVA